MSWHIKETHFDSEDIIKNGHKFLIGHLDLGVRGTLDEFRKDEFVALNLPLVYDKVDDLWSEPVNAFNPLYTILSVNGSQVNILKNAPIKHHQTLNMADASMERHSIFKLKDRTVNIQSTRFVDKVNERVVISKYQVLVDKDSELEIYTGIDSFVWDINGPHITHIETSSFNDILAVSGITQEKKIHIDVYKTIDVDFNDYKKEVVLKDGIIGYQIRFNAKSDQVYTIYQYSYIAVDKSEKEVINQLINIRENGFEETLKAHQEVWNNLWHVADIKIEGDKGADISLRYSIYHLLLLEPGNNTSKSIPARGISGQTYKGAIFWDTEVFMLPFFLNTNSDAAKSLVNYRIKGLKGALDKAKSYGYDGAFYAWESQEGGYDACTDYNVIDVFTNRPVRTYFRDKQIHISADVVYGLKKYIEHTQDYEILKSGGLEVILEVAKFYLSYGRVHPITKQLEFLDVLGPDEYHERVHNNVFTNQMVKLVFEYVIYLEKYYEDIQSNYFNLITEKTKFDQYLNLIKQYIHNIKIIKPNKAGVIEQFDGYFKLKDTTVGDLLKQRLHPNEYLGGHGLAVDTKIIKQADVLTMLYMFKDVYDLDILKTNFKYYEPKTEHGSSLSLSMYAIVAAWIGQTTHAYDFFMKSATIDLTGESKQYAGKIYIGGTHPAAAGGAYLTAIYGFAGLSIEKGILKTYPNLPRSFKAMKFKIRYLDELYQIHITADKNEIKKVEKNEI